MDEKTQEAHNAVTRIILAMARADRVEAVGELKYASAPVADSLDLVIIKEAQNYTPELNNGKSVREGLLNCISTA